MCAGGRAGAGDRADGADAVAAGNDDGTVNAVGVSGAKCGLGDAGAGDGPDGAGAAAADAGAGVEVAVVDAVCVALLILDLASLGRPRNR